MYSFIGLLKLFRLLFDFDDFIGLLPEIVYITGKLCLRVLEEGTLMLI